MKKKLVTLAMVSVLTMALVACGNESNNNNTEANSNKVNTESDSVKDDNESSNVEQSENTETKEPETEKAPAISAVKEEEAVIDFDGVKLPMTITWDEFKQFMTDNGWTFEDDEDEFPCEKHPLYGNGFINTNCGKVRFNFQENEDNTQAVLMGVTAYRVYCPATISISGINAETSIDALKEILTPVENSETGFYLDDYLEVNVNDAAFSVSRTFFHMR